MQYNFSANITKAQGDNFSVQYFIYVTAETDAEKAQAQAIGEKVRFMGQIDYTSHADMLKDLGAKILALRGAEILH
jgi:hypothetical protein